METQVLIIGGGVTGTGLARDLALRGIECILAEKQDINAGASGGNHGLLHSGARYIASDPAAAAGCRRENLLLKKLAPHCIEDTGGLFVAVAGDDENYIADFPRICRASGIPAQPLAPAEAREMEPALSDRVIAAYAVEDAAIDPFKLSLDNMAQALQQGSRLLRFSQVVGFETRAGRIQTVRLRNCLTRRETQVRAEVVVNATGAWASHVAALAGIDIHIRYSKGSLLVTHHRIGRRVINRLRKATDGDILVPGGTVSILGTTSERCASPDVIYPEIHEVDHIIDEGAAMIPVLSTTRYIRAYCGVRPLVSNDDGGDDRNVSRGFALLDHADDDPGLENFITITGGKLTTFRLMAEKTADRVCRRLGVCRPCRTHIDPLPQTIDARWTEPGLTPSLWIQKNDSQDMLLCECEMVPQSIVDQIVQSIRKQKGDPTLNAIGLRSRIGKGPCQGTFCSQRLVAYLYDRGELKRDQGLFELRSFLERRWRGQRPLLWDISLAQAELLEAMHSGLFGLEQVDTAQR
ncbi:MAG: anaerobic glycerol-3-phosphate dehydrogenase subunit A [Desulfosarcina sp.]|nr:anaerobic glycerol-3-phosphate dehydrogenase subunit A [Desulfobacterales bacterium]